MEVHKYQVPKRIHSAIALNPSLCAEESWTGVTPEDVKLPILSVLRVFR
jgi:hypothetical protein